MTTSNNKGRNPTKGISRIDTDKNSTHGWFVRIYRRKTIRKFFSDGKYGGKDGALDAAKQWRDEMYRQYPREDVPFHTERLATNTTGVHGVSESHDLWGKGAKRRKVRYYSVFWAPRKGEVCTKRFYHHHFVSSQEALAEAEKFRKAREEEIRKRYLAGKYD
ncbi:MAG: hypothetical protein HN413_13215 [Chloroflexi bacterium]|nr:hypothetical protein [Chloroflexota bacterium]